MIRFLPLILALLFTAHPAFALVAEFKPSATIDGVSITLGDIVVFDESSELTSALASQVVAPSPPPGETTTIQAQQVIRLITPKMPGKTEIIWNGASTIALTRNSIRINPAQVTTIISDFLTENSHDLPDAEIRFLPASLPMPFLLPVGEVTWEVVPSNPAILGSSRFSLIFRVDGRVRKNMSVRGKLEVLAPVAIATTSLRKGTILTPDHLTMVMHDISKMKGPCLDLSEIVAKKLNRGIKAGKPVLLGNVTFPPTVRKGELVKMIVRRGNMFLTATGIARTDGKMDQTIRVQNINSRKTVYCRVAAPGIVEVTL